MNVPTSLIFISMVKTYSHIVLILRRSHLQKTYALKTLCASSVFKHFHKIIPKYHIKTFPLPSSETVKHGD